MLGECWECEDQDVLVYSEDVNSRTYCSKCISTCVFCGKYCDYYGCENDEGDQDFGNVDYHKCYVDGKITCIDSGKLCKYRYCLSCTEKCSICDFNTVLKGHICKYC